MLYAYRFYQSLFRCGRGLAEQVLDLGEGLFYGVVVGGVRRQVEQFTPSALKQSSLMRFGLWAERLSITTIRPLCRVGTSTFSNVGLKDSSGGRPFYGQRWPHPLESVMLEKAA